MKGANYKITYSDQVKWNKMLNALRRLNGSAFIELQTVIRKLIRGKKVGKKSSEDYYVVLLHADKYFKDKYGDLEFRYTIDKAEKTVQILGFAKPQEELLINYHMGKIDVYKGQFITVDKELMNKEKFVHTMMTMLT
ncbi:MAG TPA: hypothetical protein GX690_02430 [Tenericutes bacterium]|jgi:hypothetical protein|nr:hypothetical protein [Mycoplasmatota bacterium]